MIYPYMHVQVVECHLREMRIEAEQRRLIHQATGRRSLRRRIGHLLIATGEALAKQPETAIADSG